jgi:hypothetical protein
VIIISRIFSERNVKITYMVLPGVHRVHQTRAAELLGILLEVQEGNRRNHQVLVLQHQQLDH